MSEFLESVNTDTYPWVKFKLHGERYCVTSAHVQSMGALSDLTAIPDREEWFLGMMERAGQLVPVIDMRALLHLPNLQTDLDAFAEMKHMHMSWVVDLETSVRENIPFDRNRDPHKCSFGVWYDSYKSENSVIDFILDEIREPHERLHRSASLIDRAREAGDMEKAEAILQETMDLCHRKILPLLDQLIEAYNEANRGMVIVLNSGEENSIGIVVDEIIGLEEFTDKKERDAVALFGATRYVKDIYISVNKHIYLELDAGLVLGLRKQIG